MKSVVFTKFDNQLKELSKKYKFDIEAFFKSLYREISSNPKENAAIIAETESYRILKRRVKNPKIKKEKSYGFRVWYCLNDYEIYKSRNKAVIGDKTLVPALTNSRREFMK